MNRWTVVTLVAGIAVTLTACGTDSRPGGAGDLSSGPPSCTSRVTPDCSRYTYSSPSPGTVVVTAPKTSGGNNREFFWGLRGPIGADMTVCATFASGVGIDQQGVVVRMNTAVGGGVTGISVTRNIWLGAFDVFNFHVWNTAADPSTPFTQFGSVAVPELPVTPSVYPLSMCVRTVSASDDVQFVVWTKGQTRPRWGSGTQGGEAQIPAGAPATGRGGWFAGHLTPGTTMTYRDLSVDGTVATGLP